MYEYIIVYVPGTRFLNNFEINTLDGNIVMVYTLTCIPNVPFHFRPDWHGIYGNKYLVRVYWTFRDPGVENKLPQWRGYQRSSGSAQQQHI